MLFSVDLNLESLFRNVFSSPVNTAQPRLNCLEMLPWQPAAAVVWVWLRSPVQVTSYTCVAPDFAMRHVTLNCHKIGEEWKKVWLMMYCRKNFNNFTVKFLYLSGTCKPREQRTCCFRAAVLMFVEQSCCYHTCIQIKCVYRFASCDVNDSFLMIYRPLGQLMCAAYATAAVSVVI